MYEYMAERCLREPACSRRKVYLQRMADVALTECRDCRAPITRIFSSFAARSGAVGVSSPDPTPLNITGIQAPSDMGDGSGGEGACGHEHGH